MRIVVLGLTLFMRAALSVGFALWIAASRTPAPQEMFSAFAVYSLADGVFSLFEAVIVRGTRTAAGYAVAPSVGGLLRLGAAFAIWFGPGIPYFAVTIVLYTGLLATLVFLTGIVEVIGVRRLPNASGGLRATLAVEGVATILIGLVAFILTPLPATVWMLLIVGALVEASSLLLVALYGLTATRNAPLLSSR